MPSREGAKKREDREEFSPVKSQGFQPARSIEMSEAELSRLARNRNTRVGILLVLGCVAALIAFLVASSHWQQRIPSNPDEIADAIFGIERFRDSSDEQIASAIERLGNT